MDYQNEIMSKIILWKQLTKFWLTSLVALSTATGYTVAGGHFESNMLITVVGVYLLACGVSILNHVQDRKIDQRMERTRRRPIPSGRISVSMATILSICCITLGFITLGILPSMKIIILGVLAIFCYNIIYTYLKRVTVFAILPGALVGSIPPMIGWVAAGGSVLDPGTMSVLFFFFIWQIPHFWILLLVHGNEYEKAGLPTMSGLLTRNQLKRITTAWLLVTGESCIMILLFGVMHSVIFQVGILITAMLLIYKVTKILWLHDNDSALRVAFKTINYAVLSVILFLSLDKMFYLHN